MTYLKAAIATIALVLVGLATYLFFSYDKDHYLNIALDAYQRDKYSEAGHLIDKIKKKLPEDAYHLYRGYILRAEGSMDQAMEAFDQAINQSKHGTNLSEHYLNKATNALLASDVESALPWLSKVNHKERASHYYLMLDALASYYRGDYSQALALWERSSQGRHDYPWLDVSFNKHFPDAWLQQHQIRCHLEQGIYLTGRKLLEENSRLLSTYNEGKYNFLMGLSYVKEAEEKTPSLSLPYYKLAHSYFDKVPVFHRSFDSERKTIIAYTKQAVDRFIENNSFEELYTFTDLLEASRAIDELYQLSKQLMHAFERHWGKDKTTANNTFNALLRIVKSDSVTELFDNYFNDAAESAFSNNEIQRLLAYQQIAPMLKQGRAPFERRMWSFFEKRVEDAFTNDSPSLDKTRKQLEDWLALAPSASEKLRFSIEILTYSKPFWDRASKQSKAIEAVRLASSLPSFSEEEEFHDALEAFLQTLVPRSYSENDVTTLSTLLGIAEEYHLNIPDLYRQNEVANNIEDARHALQREDHATTLQKAEWVLQVASNNIEALELAGTASFLLKNFSAAKHYLSSLPTLSLPLEETLALSRVMSQEEEGLQTLKQLAESSSLSDQSYLILGYSAQFHEETQQAYHWFKQVAEP
ncbi:hypothetical protein JYU14_05350, partial [Simkania negevensis]|nr:hypothetical protein [Simkania negevensis]